MLSLLVSSCSLIHSNKEEVTSKPSDEIEFAVDNTTENNDSEAMGIKVEEQEFAVQPAPDESAFAEVKPEEMKIETTSEMSAPTLMAEQKYKLQKGETLMIAAFKIYGDYRKWKKLKEWNPNKKISAGVELTYQPPEQAFVWKPSGEAYLVKSGDTLGLISKDKYGTPKKWKSIYENNRPLILNPNQIFAGFTIYYIPTRDVASK